MSAEAVIYNLLANNAALIAVVPVARIFPVEFPLGIAFPAIAYSNISTNDNRTIDANSPYSMVTGRIQVTIAASTYPQVKAIKKLVRQACNYQRGTIAGIIVNSIFRENEGPDERISDLNLSLQCIDFKVTYQEAN